MCRSLNNRKDDVKMCKKLKELHLKEPCDFLDQNSSMPVDIFQILQDMNIRCFCVNFNKLQKSFSLKSEKISGLTYANGNDLFVFYSDKSDLPTARFTLAHELAHCCLHIEADSSFHIEMQTIPDIVHIGRIPKFISTKKEEEADRFARELLIPTNAFIYTLKNMNVLSIEELSHLFVVPEEEIVNKLVDLREYLGLHHS